MLAERPYALITSHDYGFFYNGPAAWRLSRRSGVPYVSELHHVEGYPLAVTRRERVYRWLAHRYIPWAATRAAAFRVVNHAEMPELLRTLGVPEDKILVLPSLYLDYEVFHPRLELPQRYDLLFVGRLAPNKGLFTLLEALAQVRQIQPEVTLGIRGEGPLRPALEARIAALGLTGNVTWISRAAGLEDLARIYASARVLVCASTAEGGPRVTVEAMACGIPVISTPVGVMRELLRDGENGLGVGFDAVSLAAAITRLLADPDLRARLGAAGRDLRARLRRRDHDPGLRGRLPRPDRPPAQRLTGLGSGQDHTVHLPRRPSLRRATRMTSQPASQLPPFPGPELLAVPARIETKGACHARADDDADAGSQPRDFGLHPHLGGSTRCPRGARDRRAGRGRQVQPAG